MEKFRLHTSPSAKRDLRDIIDYINELSPESSIRIYDKLAGKIGTLSRFPRRCPLLKDPALRAKGYRALIEGDYLVFYVVNGRTVEIRRVLYGKRNYEFLL